MIVGNIYHLMGGIVIGGASHTVSESDIIALWHIHMGNIGEHGFNEIYKEVFWTG